LTDAQNVLNQLRILMLVDGFDTQGLFDSLARLLQLRQAELLLVFVHRTGPRPGLELAPRRPGGHDLAPHRERELANAEVEGGNQALAEAEKIARQLGARVESRHLDGEPGHVVCELAKAERADLVAVRGTGHGRPQVGPGSLGPTARFIVDHSPCPVLLLRDAE
jgi:nucleotide-binding universal stress UspA family protein